jgi:hypothetical protein
MPFRIRQVPRSAASWKRLVVGNVIFSLRFVTNYITFAAASPPTFREAGSRLSRRPQLSVITSRLNFRV